MSSENHTHDQSDESRDDLVRRSNARMILMAQFAFYRRLVAKKHGFTTWLEIEPSSMTDTELEQVVGFLKDAAHLPPG